MDRKKLATDIGALVDREQEILSNSALTLGQILGTLSRFENEQWPSSVEQNLKTLTEAMAEQEGIFKRTRDYITFLKNKTDSMDV